VRLARVGREDLTVDLWLVGCDGDDAAIIPAAATAKWTDYITCIHPSPECITASLYATAALPS